MRAVILGLALIVATMGMAQARDCSGQGSATVLRVEQWMLLGGGQVEVRYQLHDDKAATRLRAHVYFQIAPDDVLADASLALENARGVPARGSGTLDLGKEATRRLMAAVTGTVEVVVCTNSIDYLDGSGVIID